MYLLKLGLSILNQTRSFLNILTFSGRIETEAGDELLQENADYLLWEGYVIAGNLAAENGFNVLQENGDYILTEGV